MAPDGFLPGIYLRGAKSIVMQIYSVMLLFSDQISRGASLQGGKLPQGGRPLVEESQPAGTFYILQQQIQEKKESTHMST